MAVLWNLRSCHPPPQPKRAPSPPASPAQAGPAREARPEVWGLRTRAAPRGRCGPRRHPAQAARRTSRSWKPEAQPARGGVGPRGAPTLDEAECFAHRSRRESASPRSILFVSLSRSRFGVQFGHENAPRNRNNGTETPRKFPETDGRAHFDTDTLTRASVLSHARRRTNASSSSPRDCFGTPLKRTRVRTSRRTQCPDAGLP